MGIGFETETVKEKPEEIRRIDEIVLHYVDEHVNQCRQVYFKKFDEIYKNLEPNMIKRLDLIFEGAIKEITSDDEVKNRGLSYVERLFNALSGETYITFAFEMKDIYKALEKVVKGEPDEKFIKPVRDQSTGLKSLNEDKFLHVYGEYLLKTSNYIIEKLGTEVFYPATLDLEIDPHLESNRVDFYETWMKFKPCLLHGGFNGEGYSLEEYVNKRFAH